MTSVGCARVQLGKRLPQRAAEGGKVIKRLAGICGATAALLALAATTAAGATTHHRRCHHDKHRHCAQAKHRRAPLHRATPAAASPASPSTPPASVALSITSDRIETPSEVEADTRETLECEQYLGPAGGCTSPPSEEASPESSPAEWERECRELMPDSPTCVLAPGER